MEKYKLVYTLDNNYVDVIYLFRGIYTSVYPYVTTCSNIEDLLNDFKEFLPITKEFEINLKQCYLIKVK